MIRHPATHTSSSAASRWPLALLWCAVLSGSLIALRPAPFLVLHVAAGVAAFGLLAAYLKRHWWQRRAAIRHNPNTPWGILLLLCLIALGASGLALLIWTNSAALQAVHSGVTLLFMLALAWHLLWRVWVKWQHRLPLRLQSTVRRSGALRHWLAGVLLACFVAAGGYGVRALAAKGADTAVPLNTAQAHLPPGSLPTAQACAACHTAIAGQWQSSPHAIAATDPYYQAVTAMFIQERGLAAAAFCAGCHNPVGLLHGELDPTRPSTAPSAAAAPAAPAASAAPSAAPAASAAPYAARALGVSPAMSPASAEGVTCALCHQVSGAAAQHNGQLLLQPDAPPLPGQPLSEMLLRVQPEAHVAAFKPAFLAEAELCGSCHNLYLDGVPLEPTYDEWAASAYAARGVTCQDCHMPPAPVQRVNSDPALNGTAHGDLGTPGSLPGLAQSETLLRQAATLTAAAAGQTLTVTVANTGAGHYLPTGAADLHQVWLELTLTDAAGRLVWQAGELDENGRLPAGAVTFGKLLGDSRGQPIHLHRFWAATQVLADTRLAPDEARAIPFALPALPADAGPYRLTVRLLYRDVPPAFAEFALNRPVTDLPVYTMAETKLTLTP